MRGNKEDDAMAETMIPSRKKSMTYPQTEKGGDVFRSVLRKHRTEFPSDASQKALGHEGLAAELFAVWRKYVEMFSDLIVRCVSVNRAQTPQEMLDATGRKQYTDPDVIKGMPRGEGEKVEVTFFQVGRQASDDELEKEFASRGLKPTDPYSLAKVNQDDPAFADTHPNATHWKGADGKWHYAAFDHWGDGERHVDVHRNESGWDGHWWFAGLPVSPQR